MASLRNLMIRLGIEVDPSGAGSGLAKLQGMMEKASMAVGVASGVALTAGLTEAINLSGSRGKIQAQLGVTADESKRIGGVAGKLFSNAYGGSMDEVNTAITSVIQNMDGMRGASSAALEQTTAKAITTAQVLGDDVGKTTEAVAQIMRTGLAKNSSEAFDILTRGAQLGGNKAQDLLDTFTEYSTQFRNMGLSGNQAMGLINQGLAGGARNADLVADTIKEFSIEAVAGGARVKGGFQSLGLNADQMVAKFAKGGPTAAKAFDTVLDKLRGIEDPAKRNAVAIELFGTKAEDMGAALFKLDPSKAVNSLGQVAGAADKAGKAMGETAQSRLTTFTRTIQTNVVNALDGLVSKFNALSPETQAMIAKFGAIAAVAAPAAFALYKIGSAAVATVKGVISFGSAVAGAGPKMLSFAKFMGQGVATSAQLVTSMTASAAATARHALATSGAAAKTVILTAAQKASTIASKVMAAGIWLVNVAMRANPIGIIITLITGLVAIIVLAYKKNETFRKIVDAVWKGIRTAISFAWNNVLKPAFEWIRNFIVNVLGPKFLWFHNTIVRPMMTKIGDIVRTVIEKVKTHFMFMHKLITVTIPLAFKLGVAAIGKFWDKVKEIAKAPIRFVVNTVYNQGIARVWNWIADKTGLGRIPTIQGFARGGVLPGYSRKDDQLIMARSGEGILVPEAVKALGSGFIHQTNAAARNGGAKNVAKTLGIAGDPGGLGIPGFQEGGIVGWVKGFFAKAKNFFLEGLVKAIKGVTDPLLALSRNTIAKNGFGSMIHAAVERIVTNVIDKLKSYETEVGGGGGIGAVRAARSQLGVPYSWGGGGLGGPSYGIQQGANIRGFDCSGLTEYAWGKASGGKSIGGTTYEQLRRMKRISGPRPGAVGQPHPGHTYIATEKGGLIEAPYTGARVREVGMRHTPTWLWPAFTFDEGGIMEPGMIGVNQTREPEAVFNASQWKRFEGGGREEIHIHNHIGKALGTERDFEEATYRALVNYKRRNRGTKI
jgi:hypothetical protein